MIVPAEFGAAFAEFPHVLRDLVLEELAAGNSILEISGGFPAPPAGKCLQLAHKVSSRPRAPGNGLEFRERNSPTCSGEFTDATRFYFVLEPPGPPPPEPDMNAIRAAGNVVQRAAGAGVFPDTAQGNEVLLDATQPPGAPRNPSAPNREISVVQQFRESMTMNHERWHDGTGYDLGLLKSANPEEVAAIETLLLNRPVEDWRDVEALAALATSRTLAALKRAFGSGSLEIKMAILHHAPDLVPEAERTAALVESLEESGLYSGLTQALLQVEAFHPPEILEALLRGTLAHDGEIAVQFAAMLLFLHGRAESSFAWRERPFLLRFNTGNREERTAAFLELCERIGVAPKKYTADST